METVLGYPDEIQGIVESYHSQSGTRTTLREELLGGKSGAFVGLVDCEGPHDGVFILKVGVVPEGYEDEEACHRRAQRQGAFAGKTPEIVASHRVDKQYLLLLKLAGGSRIHWRPLVQSVTLFRSAYSSLGAILWSDTLVTLGGPGNLTALLRQVLGYQLDPNVGGRILSNAERFLGSALTGTTHFAHLDQVFPSPLAYVANPAPDTPTIRPLLGPVHGDCHASNIFVRAQIDAQVADICLIDLAAYKSSGLFFFDHAYLELATLLRQLDGIGDLRWLRLITALTSPTPEASLEHEERAWLDDICQARNSALAPVLKRFPDRQDDIRLQFLLAQTAAGLTFLNKRPREGATSAGLSPAQYRQAYLWSSLFLRQALREASVLEPSPPEAIPALGLAKAELSAVPDQVWCDLGGFDGTGFNILLLSPTFRQTDRAQIDRLLRLPWALIVDLSPEPISSEFEAALRRPLRQAWPGNIPSDVRLLSKGALWLFANGRTDITDASPATGVADWRRTYYRAFDSLLSSIADQVSPTKVRVLATTDSSSLGHLRLFAEAIDTTFHKVLAPLLVTGIGPGALPDSVNCVAAQIGDVVHRIEVLGNPDVHFLVREPLLPYRDAGGRTLRPAPPDLIARIQKDLTPVFRQLAGMLPAGRTFGVDFRRGMTVEWPELAQNLDVERDVFPDLRRRVVDALRESTNATINLLPEPSSGGTTVSRRLAWSLMEEYPVVLVDQLTEDTAAYLRDLFQNSALPVLAVMESAVVTESAREALLRQLWEDNTRVVFLWVSRAYGEHGRSAGTLRSQLSEHETSDFLAAYLEQVTTVSRRVQLQQLALATDPYLAEQRTPFFFGLNAFEENYLGLDRLIENVVTQASEGGRSLLTDLALASAYSSDGYPAEEFGELCSLLNDGPLPYVPSSPFAIRTETSVKIPHRLIAIAALRALARDRHEWKADLAQWALRLLDNVRRLPSFSSSRVKRLIETLFVTRDTTAALEADADVQLGGIARARRFSPLIVEIGRSERARTLLKRVSIQWPDEPHYGVHYARHLLYEDPRELEEAIAVATGAERTTAGREDDAVVHTVGMCYRTRLTATLQDAKDRKLNLDDIEATIQADFDLAINRFQRTSAINTSSEYGHVATVQMISRLVRDTIVLSGVSTFARFVKVAKYRWILTALSAAEESISVLRNRPGGVRSSRAKKTIAEWDLVYGNVDSVVFQLRALVQTSEDPDLRRALCSAMLSRHLRRWKDMPQADLRTVVTLMERNIQSQAFRDSDVRDWLRAYRHLRSFEIEVAIERLLDWHSLRPEAIEPPFYLYVFYFLRWLGSKPPNSGYAAQTNHWLAVCRENRTLGHRHWGFEWLVSGGSGYSCAHFTELSINPAQALQTRTAQATHELTQFARVIGTVVRYHGPQRATLDLGQGILFNFVPLAKITKDHLGQRVSLMMSFTYDGPRGWDPELEHGPGAPR